MIPATITRAFGLAAAATFVAAAVAVLPAPALATGGTTTLTLKGSAAKTLRAQGVRVVPVRPARGGARRVVLPVAASLAGATTTVLRQRGSLLLTLRGRKLRLRKLELRLGRKTGRIEATVGKRELTLFRVSGGRREIVPASGKIFLNGAQLKLTGGARKLIAQRLRPRGGRKASRKLVKQTFGWLAARVAGDAASGGTATDGGEAGGGDGTAIGCPLPSAAGPAAEESPPVKTRPLGAVDVTAATIDWHVRESFVRYINTGEGTSVSGGATADPPVVLPGTSAALSYDFHFPFASGWLDPGAGAADPADDTGLVAFSGAVRFLYSAHEIDLSTANPEIEIDGEASRVIFAISDAGSPAARQVLFNLDLSQAGAIVASGNTYTYERVPGVIPAGTASSTFAGFYSLGPPSAA